jgi:hypothetical protein
MLFIYLHHIFPLNYFYFTYYLPLSVHYLKFLMGKGKVWIKKINELDRVCVNFFLMNIDIKIFPSVSYLTH